MGWRASVGAAKEGIHLAEAGGPCFALLPTAPQVKLLNRATPVHSPQKSLRRQDTVSPCRRAWGSCFLFQSVLRYRYSGMVPLPGAPANPCIFLPTPEKSPRFPSVVPASPESSPLHLHPRFYEENLVFFFSSLF